MALYKFVPAERIDILRHQRIRFTPPALLNDPFEMTPVFGALMTEAAAEHHFEENIDNILEQEITSQFPLALQELARHLGGSLLQMQRQKMKEMVLAGMKAITPSLQSAFATNFLTHIRTQMGVLSLTARFDSLLMWAHYADSHRGFVIEFNESHAVFDQRLGPQDEFRHLRPVVYAEKKPNPALNEIQGSDLLLTKSQEWSYEHEWRIVRPLNEATAVISIEGEDVHLFEVPKNGISGVFLGAQMSYDNRKSIIDLIRDDQEHHPIKIYQAKLQPNAFGLEFIEL